MTPDAGLRRVERTALAVCGAMAAAAAVFGRFDIAAGVVGGGILSAASYLTIGSGVMALTPLRGAPGSHLPTPAHAESPHAQPPAPHQAGTPDPQPPTPDPADDSGGATTPGGDRAVTPANVSAWTVLKAALRYALLGLLAYVMIARLRLHPVGLLAGASSVVAAVSVEALRLLMKKS